MVKITKNFTLLLLNKSISGYFGFNVNGIEICTRNIINSKCYPTRKDKPLNKFDGFQNLSYAQYNKYFVINM